MPRTCSFDGSESDSEVRESSSRSRSDPNRERSKAIISGQQRRKSFDKSKLAAITAEERDSQRGSQSGYNKRRKSLSDKPDVASWETGFMAPRRKTLAELSAEKKAALQANMLDGGKDVKGGGKKNINFDGEENIIKIKSDPRLHGSPTAKGQPRYSNPSNEGNEKKKKRPNRGKGLVSEGSFRDFLELAKGKRKFGKKAPKVSPYDVHDIGEKKAGEINQDGNYQHADFAKTLGRSDTQKRDEALDREMNEGFTTVVVALLILLGVLSLVIYLLYLFLRGTEVGSSKFWIVFFIALGFAGCFSHYYKSGYTIFEILGGRTKGGAG